MILVVLFTMFLLAALLAASSQITLSSRRTTADQAASLRAQYVAESGVAVVQSRLWDIQNLLSSKNAIDDTDNFDVPGTTTGALIKMHAENFCGKSGAANWTTTSDFAEPRGQADTKSYPNALQCVIDPNSSFSSEQASVLADYLKQSAYNALPVTERPQPLSDRTKRLLWWNTLLRDSDKIVGSAKYRLIPVRVVQLSTTNYRFYIRAANIRVQGVQDSATRVLAANRTNNSDWWFEIVLPSLLDDVLMTNHHRARPTGAYSPTGAPGVNFNDQIFDGSIHTNEKFLFLNTSSAKFKGKVSSVGCNNLPVSGVPIGNDCSKVPGVYISGAPQNPPTNTTNINKWIADKIVESPRSVEFVKKGSPSVIDYQQTDFTASYKPLPLNENDQKAAAEEGGLVMDDNSAGVELVAGDSNGIPPSSYIDGKWIEAIPTYQYIRILKEKTVSEKYGCNNQGNNCKTRNVIIKVVDSDKEYRFGSDKKLYKKDSNNNWLPQNRDFNGVLYGKDFESVRGPPRKDGDAANGDIGNVPPAIASFASITLAATNDINIDSDLTVSDTPCTFAATKATPPCLKRPKNILGLYAQKGDVIISTATGKDLNLHAAIMSSEGQVTTQEYNSRPNQGDVKLIGSLIENWYGPFGTVGSLGTGYGRDFTYDQRLQEGTVPPFFPVSPRWQAQDAKATGISMTDLVLRQAPASEF